MDEIDKAIKEIKRLGVEAESYECAEHLAGNVPKEYMQKGENNAAK